VRVRALTAAVAGVCAAATGHALDAAGLLPFVHEAAPLRAAMTMTQLVLWLAVAGVLSALAATTRPLLVGAPAALLVSAAPELVGRGDPGALFEPGALCGALLQLLLVVSVVALAVLLERRIGLVVRRELRPPSHVREAVSLTSLVGTSVDRTGEPRAPPALLVPTTT
jgi:hypothetical protein